MTVTRIGPQRGPQEAFLSSWADIVIYGGSAGGGKTFGLLIEAVRHHRVPGFYTVIFRKSYPEITNAGGLWDTSYKVMPPSGAAPHLGDLSWRWPSGARCEFRHFQHEKNKLTWQGAQIAFIGWDELTHFSKDIFFYMLSRNRSTCGVRPYVRCTCNPDPDSWVKEFISWWLDETTGFPIPERSGVVRWFVREGNEIIWADDPMDLPKKLQQFAKSVTFIPAKLEDNPALLQADPAYIGQLMALPTHERERLLGGNWNVRLVAGTYFRREMFEIVDAVPQGGRCVRYWDLAATEESEASPDPDYTVGLKIRDPGDGYYYVEDVRRGRWSPYKVEQNVLRTAQQDGREVEIHMEQEPGASGKSQMATFRRLLSGYIFKSDKKIVRKELRAHAVSVQAEAGNVKLLRGPWNDNFLNETEAFPTPGVKDDQVDGLSGGFDRLVLARKSPRVRYL